jgi:hypothetical protein
VQGIQHSDPDDPFRSKREESSKDALLERTKPRHRRLAAGGEENSSSSEPSKPGNSIAGKAMESSSCSEASEKELMSKVSKEPKIDRDRFKFFVHIMGFSLLITGVTTRLRAFSRASVAGEKVLGVVMQYMLSCKNWIRKRDKKFMIVWVGLLKLARRTQQRFLKKLNEVSTEKSE